MPVTILSKVCQDLEPDYDEQSSQNPSSDSGTQEVKAQATLNEAEIPEKSGKTLNECALLPYKPHKQWLGFPVNVYPALTLLTILLFATPLGTTSFAQVSLVMLYAYMLALRISYYVKHNWQLYLVDLCYLGNVLLVYCFVLPNYASPQTWNNAFFTIMGPTLGSSVLLGNIFLLHHNEVFFSWYIHVPVSWAMFSMRWFWYPEKFAESVGYSEALAYFLALYVPWATSNLICNISKYVHWNAHTSLMDDVVGPTAKNAISKRLPWQYAKACAYFHTWHGVLTIYTLPVVTLCYNCREVHFLFALHATLCSLHRGVTFHMQCMKPDYTAPYPTLSSVLYYLQYIIYFAAYLLFTRETSHPALQALLHVLTFCPSLILLALTVDEAVSFCQLRANVLNGS